MLADAVGSELMDDFAFSVVQDGLKEALCDPAGVHAGNVVKVEQLAEGLLLSGFAMQATQSSPTRVGSPNTSSATCGTWNTSNTTGHPFRTGSRWA